MDVGILAAAAVVVIGVVVIAVVVIGVVVIAVVVVAVVVIAVVVWLGALGGLDSISFVGSWMLMSIRTSRTTTCPKARPWRTNLGWSRTVI